MKISEISNNHEYIYIQWPKNIIKRKKEISVNILYGLFYCI